VPLGGLRGRNKHAKADGLYADQILAKTWDINEGYAQTLIGKKWVSLHHYVWGLSGRKTKKGYVVGHESGDRLFCTIANLKLVTHSENNRNKVKNPKATSRFVGVYWRRGRWQANITYKQRRMFLGAFVNEIHAGWAYRLALAIIEPECSQRNFLNLPAISRAIKEPLLRKIQKKVTNWKSKTEVTARGKKSQYQNVYTALKNKWRPLMFIADKIIPLGSFIEEIHAGYIAQAGLFYLDGKNPRDISGFEAVPQKMKEEFIAQAHDRLLSRGIAFGANKVTCREFIEIGGGKVKVPLNGIFGQGYFLTIFKEDIPLLMDFSVHVNANGYPCAGVNGINTLVHRHIYASKFGPIPADRTVDHTFQDILDVTELSLKTASEQARNKGPRNPPVVKEQPVVGVVETFGRWASMICFKRIHYHLGDYEHKPEAAFAYNVGLDILGDKAAARNVFEKPLGEDDLSIIRANVSRLIGSKKAEVG